jgi:hypothetical protein
VEARGKQKKNKQKKIPKVMKVREGILGRCNGGKGGNKKEKEGAAMTTIGKCVFGYTVMKPLTMHDLIFSI